MESMESSDSESVACVRQAAEQFVAGVISRMEPERPDIIQAVAAWQALTGLGRAFRRKARRGQSRASFRTERLDEFWSHSWHGSQWKKICTAIYLNNSFCASLLATLGSLAMCLLVGFRVLPIPRFQQAPKKYPQDSCVCTVVGFFLYCFFLISWRPWQRIFLDILCIDQDDSERKTAALVSMGAFLKVSDSLLVLWDPSYTRRLWCVFEMAGFLHSRGANRPAKLTIRPTVLGPFFISLPIALSVVLLAIAFLPPIVMRHARVIFLPMALLAFVGFYVSVAALRGYYRSVKLLETELANFTVAESCCWCCNTLTDHTCEGKEVICDRQVVFRCIVMWFGTIESFEERVRTEVLDCLADQLSKNVFTYKQCAAASLPLFWYHMDRVVTRAVEGSRHSAIRELARGTAWAFGVLPVIFFIASTLAFLLRRQYCGCCSGVVMNCLILVIVVAAFVGLLELELLCWAVDIVENGNKLYDLLPGSCFFMCAMLSVAALVFACKRNLVIVAQLRRRDRK
ncbi:rpl22 [Symbiodinium natans]|uniref:Rpl22 protein n=1 Tax=Symbiodinium natans TaxID=878477 RepID=A0A812RKM7_9DINO|nr:rpl22 [Symbiodinium natans]